MREEVKTNKAPSAIGAYSQAVRCGNLLFTSGQLGLCPETGEFPQNSSDEYRQALSNLLAVIAAGGGKEENVLKVTIFLRNLGDFPAVNEIYKEFFSSPYPAREVVGVYDLPKGGKIEVSAVVWVGE